ncbi:MAG: thioredoxin domain-containing protein, partial [Myxococcota bacterium]
SAVHSATQLPVAAWGLVWALMALALPLAALWARAERREAAALLSATRLTAAGGVVAVLGLLAASLAQGGLCTLCVGTYLLTGAYGAIALFVWRKVGLPDVVAATQRCALAFSVAFLALLYPGLQTPRSVQQSTSEAIRGASPHAAEPTRPSSSSSATQGSAHTPAAPQPTGPAPTPSTDAEMTRFVGSLPKEVQGMLSSSLGMWRAAPPIAEAPPARSRWGSAESRVQIVEWTDVLCGHCAQMHATLEEIARVTPPGSFAVEPRHFPLDASCNPEVQRRNPAGPVSCVAAGVQICLEGDPRAHELSSELFAAQRELTVEKAFEIGSRYRPRAELEQCVHSAETKRKLDDDIAYAMRLDPEGTPIVTVNGKKANGFGAFLYALILTQGTGEHPALATLPPPDLNAHIH